MARILAVDDEPAWLDFAKECLEPLGHEVETVQDEREIRRKVDGKDIDLVILDIQMPVNGRLLLGYLKRFRPSLPVLVYSAYGMKRFDPDFQIADSFVVKSPDPDELVRSVEELLV